MTTTPLHARPRPGHSPTDLAATPVSAAGHRCGGRALHLIATAFGVGCGALRDQGQPASGADRCAGRGPAAGSTWPARPRSISAWPPGPTRRTWSTRTRSSGGPTSGTPPAGACRSSPPTPSRRSPSWPTPHRARRCWPGWPPPAPDRTGRCRASSAVRRRSGPAAAVRGRARAAGGGRVVPRRVAAVRSAAVAGPDRPGGRGVPRTPGRRAPALVAGHRRWPARRPMRATSRAFRPTSTPSTERSTTTSPNPGRGLIIEPGRGVVGDAGALVTEVVGVSWRGGRRWVYLDAGIYSGLVETLGEAIRYRLTTDRDDDERGPVVLAGPTCDSVDVLYERTPVQLRSACARATGWSSARPARTPAATPRSGSTASRRCPRC